MQGFFDFVKSLDAARLGAMAAVTLALVGFFSFIMVRMTTPEMVPLFTDLTLDHSASILKELEQRGLNYELKNGGAVITVPRSKVGRLRMTLAEDGLPKGGGVGYEIFDKSDTLGAISFIQNIYRLRALEGEIGEESSGGPNVSIVSSEEKVAISNRTSEMIDFAQVHGKVPAKSVQKVGELAYQNPHETDAIIHSWLHEDAA